MWHDITHCAQIISMEHPSFTHWAGVCPSHCPHMWNAWVVDSVLGKIAFRLLFTYSWLIVTELSMV